MQTRTKPHKRSRRAGFTLMEVLLVLIIIGVIFALVGPQLLGRQKQANVDATKASIGGVEQALKLYAIDHSGEYPQGGQEVYNTLLQPSSRDGRQLEPYLEKQPLDAWGKPLQYEYPNSKGTNSTRPAIWSVGPNQQDEGGGGDDINNWTT